jgi:hypothetical protein
MAFKYHSFPVVSTIKVNKPIRLVLGTQGTDIVVPGHKIGIGGNPDARTKVLGNDKTYTPSSSLTTNKLPNISIDSLLLRNEEYSNEFKTQRKIIQRKQSYFDIEESFLKKLSGTIDNLNKFLSALSYKIHYAYQTNKLEETMIIKRHEQVKEFLLEKEAVVDKKVKKQKGQKDIKTDKEKIDALTSLLISMGFVGSMVNYNYLPTVTGPFTVRGATFARQMMSRFGLTDIQAAAIFGVMSWESALIPYNVENSSPYNAQEPLPPPYGATYVGYGWPQWTNLGNTPGDRLNYFITNYLGGGPGKRGKAATDQDNMNYLIWELTNRVPYKDRVIRDLKKQNTVEGAVNSFLNLYEGVPGNRVQERIQRTMGILKEMRKAVGGIVIPELFGRGHVVKYDTDYKDTTLSNFIVDKPTVINTQLLQEPLVIIPLEKPIGRTILNILFRPIFNKIEQALNPRKKAEIENELIQEQQKRGVTTNNVTATARPKPIIVPFEISREIIQKTITPTNKTAETKQTDSLDIFQIPLINNIIPTLNSNVEEPSFEESQDKTPSISLPQNAETKKQEMIKPFIKSDLDTIDKLSTKTNISFQKQTNVVIFTRDILV